MQRYVLKRTVALVPTLFGVSVLVFLMVRLIPGSIVEQIIGDMQATEELIQRLRQFFGLDRPLHEQYLSWLGQVLQGNLGRSWRTDLPVTQMIVERLPVTFQLTAGAMLVALIVGVPLGILSAIRENTGLDHVVRVVSLFSLSIPVFWQATMLILGLSLWFRWAPLGYIQFTQDPVSNLKLMFWPSVVLGTASAAQIMRLTRSSLLDVMRQDYIRTARAKGLGQAPVVWSHALKNSFIPVLTVAGLQVGYLLGGLVVTEEVFTLPGVGRLLLWGIYQRDYPLIQGTILFVAVLFLLTNLIVDLLYGFFDPRIRYD
jgi:peptide/nickel transport system permease protein